ncbi:gamma-glutamyltransferase [Sciscionella marina]|uniref:gamma-glutamyltransferase n=1 Tax=Sciscionella marina TaxID=508770 RepID=UPI0003680CDD|nr:gamma-glutamyltransferase [Sciscionella marina]
MRTRAGAASGDHGAVTVAYGAPAARAGLEALRQGGTAADAAMTTALAQVALTAGSAVSYFGIMSLVYYEARTGEVHTMNAEWNTVAGENDPLSIPGGVTLDGSVEAARGAAPSGRAALVGGFLKGVEAGHQRFGRLPFASLFGPAIEFAERGIPISPGLGLAYTMREEDLRRLPETRETLLKQDGSRYHPGETLRQPRLARTLRQIAAQGTDHLYHGSLGERIVEAVRADGGRMTMRDLHDYEVRWAPALRADIGEDLVIATAPWPNAGGVAMIEAQNLAVAAGLTDGPHWTESGESLRHALDITQLLLVSNLPADTVSAAFPGLDFSPENRVTPEHARLLWQRIADGSPLPWKTLPPRHSDDVVAVDEHGNIAAITHSINCVLWGRPAIVVDGITVGDPGAHQQQQIAATEPGGRLPAPTETGIVFRADNPVLGFASMGSGLHQKTFQCLLNHLRLGMTVEEAVNKPDFFMPSFDPATGTATAIFHEGEYDHAVLEASGLPWTEVSSETSRFGGEGYWVAISRDPVTGRIEAASHNRNNSAALAY